ncbi:MAG: TetR/AcrR family transcriptional regulator [Eubacterium sp.]|nr:TetR/AcrR family transcriptional regulator [Eubacterium sp.]
MPRDKTENHEKIISAALTEFLEYGFKDASMRRIAEASGMSASGLYKHFPSKEDMFAALVEPTVQGFMELYGSLEDDYFEDIHAESKDEVLSGKSESVRIMEYIYEHIDEFRLLICKSQGTRYESFTHDMAMIEEKETLKYMKALKKAGFPVKDIKKKEFHLLATASVDAMFQAVIHDFSKKEALHYAKTLEEFYEPAWKQLFGL